MGARLHTTGGGRLTDAKVAPSYKRPLAQETRRYRRLVACKAAQNLVEPSSTVFHW